MVRKFHLLFLALPLLFVGCHTYFWQNVETDIEGTWTFMPVEPGNTVQFTFEAGKLSITRNSVPVLFEHIDNGSTTSTIDYTVENNFNNHYVYISDEYHVPGFGYKTSMFERTLRWLVITAKDDELFLESEGKEGLKGEFQLHFFRF